MLQPLTVALFAGDALEVDEDLDEEEEEEGWALCVTVDGEEKCWFRVDQRLVICVKALLNMPLNFT